MIVDLTDYDLAGKVDVQDHSFVSETGNVNELFLVLGYLKIKLTEEQFLQVQNFFEQT